MRNALFKKIPAFMLIFAVAAGMLLSAPCVSYGAVQRPSAAAIPSGTLVIGTHLIHIKALNSGILAVAAASATASLQTKTFYKSEFSGGAWFDISSASGFSDITAEGRPVSNSVIDALKLTHWTGEDGKTIDLSTGLSVDIDKISDPTDLSTLPELAELKTRRDMLIETLKRDHTAENDQKLKSIERIIIAPFSSQESTAVTDNMDALEKYINYLKDKDTRPDWVNAVVELKSALNTAKTLLCYREALSRLNTEISFAETKILGADNKPMPAADLSAAYYSCLDAVNKKILELESSVSGAQGPGALNRERARFQEAMIASAVASEYDKADTSLEKYMSVKNILGGLKPDIPLELSILKPLPPGLTAELAAACAGGLPSEYAQAEKDGEPQLVLDSLRAKHVSGLSDLSADIKSIIGYIKERESDALQLEGVISPVLKSCLDTISKVPQDAAEEGAVDVLKQLVEWLNGELSLLREQQSDTSLSDELASLDEKISDLTLDYLSALDRNDLSEAGSIKDEIDGLAAQKADIYENAAAEQSKLFEEQAELKEKLEKALNSGDSAAAGDLLDRLSDVNAALGVQGSATDGLTAVANAAAEDLFAELEELLDQNNFTSALSKTQEISDMLNASKPVPANAISLLNGVLPKVQSKLEDAVSKGNASDAEKLSDIEEPLNSLLEDAAGRDSFGEAGTEALEAALSEKLNSLMSLSGIDPDTADGLLLKALLLQRLGESPEYSELGDRIKTLQGDVLALLGASGRDYTVDDFKMTGGEYLASVRELASITGRRYVWRQDSGSASLVSGRSAMVFTKNSPEVTVDKKPKRMSSSTVFSGNTLYVPLSFTAGALNYSWFPAGPGGKPLLYPVRLDKIADGLLK